MDKNIICNQDDLQSKIYTIRGLQVMLDYDLAQIYGYEVKRLNEQVKRNIGRFPEDFMFQLNRNEVESVKSQFATSPYNFDNQLDNENAQSALSRTRTLFLGQDGGTRKLPYAFTEQGVYMLATVLHGRLAEQQSIFIMRAFRELKHYVRQNIQFATRSEMQILSNSILAISKQNSSLKEKQQQTDDEIKKICENIDRLNENFVQKNDFKNFVIYKGQKFEADTAYIDIYSSAQKSIFVIDNYVNIKTLNLLKHKKINTQVILFTQNIHSQSGFLTQTEVSDFDSQYPTLLVKSNPDCHDRFIIIDYKTSEEKVYHCGASSKDAGNKVCAINKLENTMLLHPVIEKLLLQPNKNIST